MLKPCESCQAMVPHNLLESVPYTITTTTGVRKEEGLTCVLCRQYISSRADSAYAGSAFHAWAGTVRDTIRTLWCTMIGLDRQGRLLPHSWSPNPNKPENGNL